MAMMTASTSTLKKRTGIVILKGNAARLASRGIAIAPKAMGHKIKLFPENRIAATIRTVNTQP